ncbi:4-hydroxy-tetrahydrodipicolinate reductase [hydrothermal vent metagenome]|uniref:4-hydroxy-tetrahydrodipicolinate reductase n=1 Tax=hydrothermal vent metagenome TaxID=652676 RepID=A0A3B1DP28_9ZZZZ
MINVTVAGATGRTGSRIAALCIDHPEINLVGALERKGHEKIGQDIGVIIGTGEANIPLGDKVEDMIDDTDVVIDFTSVNATIHNLRVASEKGKAMVIGTTGFSKEDMQEVRALARNIPCVMAPNMSVGVNLLFKVLKDVAVVLGDDYDIEIIEAHHRMKQDAPSGTALKLAQVVAEALGRNLDEVAIYARKGFIGERGRKEIGIQTIRAGDIVGEHTVMFAGTGERIEITHKASSRDTFAAGAVRAALWVYGRNPGLYDMLDVLGLK